jgi:3-deoxy-manno-octulosonate cytidylyltransferase (CMP-KDO synthetase)
MIVRTHERACRYFAPRDVIIATDDDRIVAACRDHGITQVEMTDASCRTGTDRVAQVAARYPGVDVWVNIQGDEPLLPDGVITPLLNKLTAGVAATNGQAAITEPADVVSDTIPKVVAGSDGNALYMSRAPIPWHNKTERSRNRFGRFDRRDAVSRPRYRQVCVYAFWAKSLARFAELETGPCEQCESIEILRLIEHGYKVRMVTVPGDGISVDVPADIARVRTAGRWT